MKKKLQDLKPEQSQLIDLKKDSKTKSSSTSISQNKNSKKIQDIYHPNDHNHIFIKGRQNSHPDRIGGILKITFWGFIIVFIINIINIYYNAEDLKLDLENSARQAYSSLLSVDEDLTNFSEAAEIFKSAEENLWFINKFHNSLNDASLSSSVRSAFELGNHLATAGVHFTESLEAFREIPKLFFQQNTSNTALVPDIAQTLKVGLRKTDLAIEEINLAKEKIAHIDQKILPTELQERFSLAKKSIEDITLFLNRTSQYFPALLKLLGDRYPHRFLILLQNNNESRPTGGFIGSYMIVDLNDGYIDKLDTYDVYDIDGSYGAYIEPPAELQTFTQNWRLRDSNYSPDFAISAAKAAWFLEKENGPGVDTVIAINQSLLRDLLEITGPVQVSDFGKLDSTNYNLLLSYIIEAKVWGKEDPKHILKTFISAFKDALITQDNLPKLSSVLFKAIQQKQLLFYSKHQDIQDLFDEFSLSARVYQNTPDQDYLSVINISTGGNKSDQFIEENIQHHTEISTNGEIVNYLSITRTHLWEESILTKWEEILQNYGFPKISEEVLYVLGKGRNRSSIRIYVPTGSILLGSSTRHMESKYDSELNKTYFFTGIEVDPGQSKTIQIAYILPYKLDLNEIQAYKLVIQKQPGSIGSIFTKTIVADKKIQNLALFPQDTIAEQDGSFTYATNLSYDRYFSSLWQAN